MDNFGGKPIFNSLDDNRSGRVNVREFVDALQTYFAGSRVAWSDVVARYAPRVATESRWRTLARIMSDSGHACSAQLHAHDAVHKLWPPRHRRDVLPTHCLICAQARRGGRLDLRI